LLLLLRPCCSCLHLLHCTLVGPAGGLDGADACGATPSNQHIHLIRALQQQQQQQRDEEVMSCEYLTVRVA
jgi:hypothetical protein